jgi:hypothetical protein
MDPVTNVSAQDLIEVAIPDQGSASGYKTGKESLAQVGNFIANGISYAGLPTTDQTLTGAISEVNQKTELKGIDTTATTPIYEAYTLNGSDALTYTATQDCLVSLTCQASASDSMTWDIDGAIVLTSHYQAPYPVSGTFPLKAGQTASKRIVTSQCFAAISVNAFE